MGKTTHNYEAICFSLYFSLKYNFEINDISADEVISSDSCLFKFFAFLYYKVHNISDEKKKLKEHAFFYLLTMMILIAIGYLYMKHYHNPF